MNDDGDPRTDDVDGPARLAPRDAPDDIVAALAVGLAPVPCRVCDNPCAEGYEEMSWPLCEACDAEFDEYARLMRN